MSQQHDRDCYQRYYTVKGGLAVPLAAVLAATGCGLGSYGSVDADRSTFTYLSVTDVVTEWDPAASYSNELVAFPNMYETLTRYAPETQSVVPLLATDWQSLNGGLVWNFELRDDVTFHSGAPMTADAVKAAIERTIELDAGAAYLWDAVESITAPDEHTVTFTLSYPAPLELISSASYAAYVYEVPEDADDFEARSFGTGPYTVEEWNPGEETELTLTQHEDYWQGWDGDHYQNVEYRVVPQASTATGLMEAGEAHFAQQLPAPLLDRMHSAPNVRVAENPSWQNLFGLLNTEKEPLNDPRVRQAVAHAVNYTDLLFATEGAFTESTGVIPEGMLGYQPFPDLRLYDPDRSEELLEEAGYGPADSLELTLTYTEGEEVIGTMAALMQEQLASVNIELLIEPLPWESGQWPRAQEEDPEDRQDILLMYWWPDDPQPLSWFFNMFRTEEDIVFNLGYYSNPDFDDLVDQVGEVTATDEAEAAGMYSRMQDILIEDTPALFLGTRTYQRAISSSVGGYVDNPLYANVVFVYDCFPR